MYTPIERSTSTETGWRNCIPWCFWNPWQILSPCMCISCAHITLQVLCHQVCGLHLDNHSISSGRNAWKKYKMRYRHMPLVAEDQKQVLVFFNWWWLWKRWGSFRHLEGSNTLLYTFQFLQAVWRWLFKHSNNINKDDRQHLMRHFQKLVFSPSEDEFQAATESAVTDKVTAKYPNYQEYAKRFFKRQQEWALWQRKNLIAGGNNTYNYPESMINIFKSVILQRMTAYDLIELFKFIKEDLEITFQRKLLALAFRRTQNPYLTPRSKNVFSPKTNL